MPVHIRTILSASDESLSNLAKLADKIFEVAEIKPINSAQSCETASTSSSFSMEKAIDSINRRLDQLTKDFQSSRARSKSRSIYSSRHRSSSRKRDSSSECWYHRVHKSNATKCKQPCTYKQKN